MKSKKIVVLLAMSAALAACGGGTDQASGEQRAASLSMSETAPSYVGAQQAAAAQTAAPPVAALPANIITATSSGARAALAPTAAASTATAERGMWSWVDSDIATTAKQTLLLDFAKAHRITVIYLNAEGLLNKPALLTSFIEAAARNRIAVELLFGSPDWALSANHAQAVALLKKAGAYVAGLKGARPVGVQFDVEPHVMPQWSTDAAGLGQQLIDLYQKLAAAKPAGLYLNADIAMGYEYLSLKRAGVTRTMSQWLVDATDRTTLMAYRDYATGDDSIVSHARHPVDYATLRGKRSVIGVETTCNLKPAKITFCEEGNAKMEIQLGSVTQSLAASAGYGGLAIHDYQHYRLLK